MILVGLFVMAFIIFLEGLFVYCVLAITFGFCGCCLLTDLLLLIMIYDAFWLLFTVCG